LDDSVPEQVDLCISKNPLSRSLNAPPPQARTWVCGDEIGIHCECVDGADEGLNAICQYRLTSRDKTLNKRDHISAFYFLKAAPAPKRKHVLSEVSLVDRSRAFEPPCMLRNVSL
jgi:hypothetical protein